MNKIVLFLFLLFCLKGFTQEIPTKDNCNTNVVNVIILGEKQIDSLFFFGNPKVRDPREPYEEKIKGNLWKKSFNNSSLRGCYSTVFNPLFFYEKTFDNYDKFVLSPTSYIFSYSVSFIKELVFPYIDSTYQKKIENMAAHKLGSIYLWKSAELYSYNNYCYAVYKPVTSSFLEVALRVPYYNEAFHKHFLSDPPICLFCNKSYQDILYVKMLIPMSEDTK